MNTIHTLSTETAGSINGLPTLHLVVAPTGEQEAIRQALQLRPELLVLQWRLAAETLKLVSDAELSDLMTQRLQAGGQLAVWHGEKALDHADLARRLGQQWAQLCIDRLIWTRIRRVDTPGSVPWVALAERLDRPEETVVRQMFFSDGQRLPRWSGLSDALNRQARIAHAAWYQAQLAPLQGALDELTADDASTAQAASVDENIDEIETEVDTPAAADSAPTTAYQPPYYDNSHSLEASVLSAAAQGHAPQTETISAQLQPTSHAKRWLADQWKPNVRVFRGAAPPLVEITLAPEQMECHVMVTLPANAGPGRWLLCLYPNAGLPFSLRFESQDGDQITKPNWPKAPDLQPDPIFWQAIKEGSVGLDRLS